MSTFNRFKNLRNTRFVRDAADNRIIKSVLWILFLSLLTGLITIAIINIKPYAMLLARTVRRRYSADWGLAETGATGPTGNRYGDAAGRSCLAVAGATENVVTLETGKADRPLNMRLFAAEALRILVEQLSR